jgi:PIN domain nuclease of toxin-antitoxin system
VSLLLDSHAFIWWMTAPERLSPVAFTRIGGNTEVAYLSAATAYEIEFKSARNPRMPSIGPDLPSLARVAGFSWLSIEAEDAAEAARLAGPHRDPWDRILAAQAKRRNFELITADAAIHAAAPGWGVRLLW